MKNSADLGGCYPPWPLTSVDNTLLDLQNSSYPTQPHSIITKYAIKATNSYSIGKDRDCRFQKKPYLHHLHYSTLLPRVCTRPTL